MHPDEVSHPQIAFGFAPADNNPIGIIVQGTNVSRPKIRTG